MPQWSDNSPAWRNIESPFKGFQEGLQTGVQIGGLAIQRQAQELQLKAQAQNMAAQAQTMQAAEESLQYNLATHRNMLDLQAQMKIGEADFSGVVSEIAANGDWSKPESQSKLWDAIARNPTLASSPFVKATMDNVEKSSLANLKAKQFEAQAETATRRADTAQQLADIAAARQKMAEEKAAQSGTAASPKISTPFPDMPWVRMVVTETGAVHFIQGDRPLTAMEQVRTVEALGKAQTELDYLKPTDKGYANATQRVQILQQALHGTAPSSKEPATVDPDEPLGIFIK